MPNNYSWLNEKSRKFLEKDYLTAGQTPESRIRDIALNAEKILDIKGFADRFEDYMAKGFYSLASPIWANFGNKRGCPISCFNSHISDTMDSILYKAAEVGTMTKIGGGTSAYFGELRERGAPISVGGTSSGPVHFMEIFETISNVVSQSSIRRGSFAAYLDIEHPDIEEFLKIRSDGNKIQHISLGVCVSDDWMNSMIDGDKKKRDIWARVIQKRFESGYPYIFFTDNVNKNSPKVYRDKGKRIKSSNLCVVGDTLIDILINDKTELKIQIKDLNFFRKKHTNLKIKSFDKEKNQSVYSEILNFARTGESTEIIEIEDESGNILKCTPEHKIYTKNRGYVQAQYLKEDDVLEISAL